MQEFVVFNQYGKEVDWIDPVENFTENENYWIVDNGIFTYEIKRQYGHTYKIRNLK